MTSSDRIGGPRVRSPTSSPCGADRSRPSRPSEPTDRTTANDHSSQFLGVWLIIAPWAVRNLDSHTAVIVSNVVVGAVIAAAGAVALGLGTLRIQRH